MILALVDGIYGSKINDNNLIKLQITAITMAVLPVALCYYSQNLVYCKYLFPNEEIYIAAFNPYLISTLFNNYTYLRYFS